MRTTYKLLSVTIAMGLAACVGGISDMSVPGENDPVEPPPGSGTGTGTGSGGGSATARDYYNANVYPAVHNMCGGTTCHSQSAPGVNAPPFSSDVPPTTDDTAAWTLITGMSNIVGSYTATAPLLSIPQTTAHFAKFTNTQVTAITSWLSLETTWRNQGGGGTTVVDYLAQFTGCMRQADFDTANVAKAYAEQVNTSEGTCKQCHVNGQAQSYFIATPSSTNMYTAISSYREYLSTFFTVDNKAVVLNMVPFTVAADGGPNGQHPKNWDATNNKGMQAMKKFYDLTMEHMNGTTLPACGNSTLTN